MNAIDNLIIKSMVMVADGGVDTNPNSVSNIVNGSRPASGTDTVNDKINALGSGAISIATRAGMFIAIVAMIGCGIGLIISNAQKREEAKEKLIWGLIGAGIVFAATGIINLVQSATQNMF